MQLSLFSWFGGKGNLFDKILPYLDVPHQVYVEVYGGGASVLLNKQPSKIEVLNDIDDKVVNIFRVMQDEQKFNELKHRLEWTLYSRSEFVRALDIVQSGNVTDPVMLAWAFFVGQNQGFSGQNCREMSEGNWRRGFVNNKATEFANKVCKLDAIRNRLKNVQVDSIDAIKCIEYWDTPNTLFYLDPPYISDTRITKKAYHHETDDDHHRLLVQTLLKIKGKAVLSGYEHDIYNPLLHNGWQAIRFKTSCHAAGRIRGSNLLGNGSATKNASRTEVIYVNTREPDMFSNQENLKSLFNS
jgi:DNA adenine methylase